MSTLIVHPYDSFLLCKLGIKIRGIGCYSRNVLLNKCPLNRKLGCIVKYELDNVQKARVQILPVTFQYVTLSNSLNFSMSWFTLCK